MTAAMGRAPAPPTSLYALQMPLLAVGVIAALVALVTQDGLVAVAVFSLFALAGAIWRTDMLPILPACIAFQWLSASSCYIYFHNFGRVPGGGFGGGLGAGLVLSMVGLAAVVGGLRLGMHIFQRTVLSKTLAPPTNFNIRRVFILTLVLFAISYFVNILPKQIWFGGAQIIENLLALRFVPYFLLLVAVFQQRRGYKYVLMATLWVLGPQLLTGFSDFKEILIVIIVAALAQWRPWVRSAEQKRQNRRILLFGLIGAILVGYGGLLWSGGVKVQWRDLVWRQQVDASPVAKMGMFFKVVGDVAGDFDIERAAETLVARSSSGALYFSYVIQRVPETVPHENGRLFGMAITNATQPRFLFADKANLGGDSWLVRKFAGAAAAGDESGASIGLGYLAEFFIDFGLVGVIVLAWLWGMLCAMAIALFARVSASREIFMAVTVGMLIQYLMVFDASFIKLLAGMVQHTLIAAVVIGFASPMVQRWLIEGARPGASPPQPSEAWRRAPV